MDFEVSLRARLDMRIAFGIVSLFPGGGLQRDCLRLACMARARGHDITVFASRLKGDLPAEIPVEILPVRIWTNHQRNLQFSRALRDRVAGGFDLIVGFDKLQGLDVLYCADRSIVARPQIPIMRLLPRYRAFRALERASFERGMRTRILLMSANQFAEYRAAWDTEPERVCILPPVANHARLHPEYRHDGTRTRVRETLKIPPCEWLWLAVGVQPYTKGFDRIIREVAAAPQTRLAVAGLNGSDREARHLIRLAQRLGVADRLSFLGFREDVPALMSGADLLVHPARYDTTGTVLLEAIINGLPVITTAACGYAQHVLDAGAGIVLPEPFDAMRFHNALQEARVKDRAKEWSANAVRYGGNRALFTGLDDALEAILGAQTGETGRH